MTPGVWSETQDKKPASQSPARLNLRTATEALERDACASPRHGWKSLSSRVAETERFSKRIMTGLPTIGFSVASMIPP